MLSHKLVFKESKNFKTIESLVDFLRGFLGSSDARRLLPLAPQEQAVDFH